MDYKNADYNKFGKGFFPDHVGIEVVEVAPKTATARMEVTSSHFAPNGYLHAGSVVTLADTIAGYGCIYNLPENAISFTTVELKTNFLGSVKGGFVKAVASLQHGGKTTQIWDVVVTSEESGKTIALFRCTQLILY